MEQPVPVSWLYAEARVAPLFTALASFLVLLQLIWEFEPQPLHRVVPKGRYQVLLPHLQPRYDVRDARRLFRRFPDLWPVIVSVYLALLEGG